MQHTQPQFSYLFVLLFTAKLLQLGQNSFIKYILMIKILLFGHSLMLLISYKMPKIPFEILKCNTPTSMILPKVRSLRLVCCTYLEPLKCCDTQYLNYLTLFGLFKAEIELKPQEKVKMTYFDKF